MTWPNDKTVTWVFTCPRIQVFNFCMIHLHISGQGGSLCNGQCDILPSFCLSVRSPMNGLPVSLSSSRSKSCCMSKISTGFQKYAAHNFYLLVYFWWLFLYSIFMRFYSRHLGYRRLKLVASFHFNLEDTIHSLTFPFLRWQILLLKLFQKLFFKSRPYDYIQCSYTATFPYSFPNLLGYPCFPSCPQLRLKLFFSLLIPLAFWKMMLSKRVTNKYNAVDIFKQRVS